MRCPCRGCTERAEACHDVCPRYLEWKTRHEAARKAFQEDRAMAMTIVSGKKAYLDRMAVREKRRGRKIK